MNWFERYGIPGTYFVGILAMWSRALWHLAIPTDELTPVFAIAAIVATPIGYILSVFCQSIYFIGGGMHYKGAKQAQLRLTKCRLLIEPTLEVNALFSCSQKDTYEGRQLEEHKFVQEWIRKRMDVVAMNKTVVVATVFGVFFATMIPSVFPDLVVPVANTGRSALLVVAIFVTLGIVGVMVFCSFVLSKQIAKVIGQGFGQHNEWPYLWWIDR